MPSGEVKAAATYAKAEKAAATRQAYKTDFAIFQAWCADRGASALPAEPATVAAFLAWEANRQTRPSTIGGLSLWRAVSANAQHGLRCIFGACVSAAKFPIPGKQRRVPERRGSMCGSMRR
jgi:hypothetical protein